MNAITTVKISAGAEVLAMIDSNPKLQPTTKAQYRKAITNYLATGASLIDAPALAAHALSLPKSSRSFLKAGIRLWAEAAVLEAKSLADPTANIKELFEVNQRIQSAQYKKDSLIEAIPTLASKGQKAHIWLGQSEVKRLLDSCNLKTTAGKRDKVILGLLVGAGLRREELAGLTFEDIVTLPMGGKFRVCLNVVGKGAKTRTVPLNDKLAAAVDTWGALVGNAGPIARSIAKGGAIGASLSAIGIFEIVNKAGAAIGKPELAPHDLRRTYAQLGYEAGVPITQISKLLGHSSVATTQRYLNLDLDLATTISDFIPF